MRTDIDEDLVAGQPPRVAVDSGSLPRATLDQRSHGACADPSQTAQARSDLKPARTSSEKSFGCSQAA